MENLRKRIKIRIVKNEKDIIKHISKPSYLSLKIFTNLTLNKPIYVGITVLEASKLATYSFHYHFLKNIFNDFKLLFTDTDSLCYKLCDKHPYENFYEHKEYFYLSNDSKDSKYFCNDNKKVLGKMKDEYGGNVIKEFIGLRSKMYLRHKMRGIKSKNCNLTTYASNKTSTSCFDDIIYIQENGIDTLPYGHEDIPKSKIYIYIYICFIYISSLIMIDREKM